MKLFGYLNTLRTAWCALVAADAVCCLAQTRNIAVVTDKESSAFASIIRVFAAVGNVAFVDAFVILHKYGWNIDTVRAWHTVIAGVARYGRIFHHLLRRLFQKAFFMFRARMQRRISADVVLKIFHVSHSAQYGEHSFES